MSDIGNRCVHCGEDTAFGSFSLNFEDFSSNSSLIISLHKSTHSSHMNTDGPAINLATSFWFLQQKEQCKSFDEFFVLSSISIPLSSVYKETCLKIKFWSFTFWREVSDQLNHIFLHPQAAWNYPFQYQSVSFLWFVRYFSIKFDWAWI